METAQIREANELLLGPSVPPKGDVCFINRLPPELVSRIFILCSVASDLSIEKPDIDALEERWRGLCNFFQRSGFVPARFDDEDIESSEDDDDETSEDDDDDETSEDDDDETSEDDDDDDEGHKGGDQEGNEEEGEEVDDEVDKDDGESEEEGEDGEDNEDENWEDEDSEEDSFANFWDTTPGQFPIDPSLFAFVASHVCRYWRDIALSTPFIRSIDLIVVADYPKWYERKWMRLERSGSAPVDIEVLCDVHTYTLAKKPSEGEVRRVFSRLIPHIHRWRKMLITVADYGFMYDFFNAVADPAIPIPSQLTTLKLRYRRGTDEFNNFAHPTMPKHIILFGGSAPLLTKLLLWGVPVDWDQPWIASASNLKELELACHPEDLRPSWTQFAAILRNVPALEKLALCQSGPSGNLSEWWIDPTAGSTSNASLDAPINLSRLTHFALAFHPQDRAIGLLRKLYLPALKHLALAFNEGDFTNFVRVLAGPATSLTSVQQQPRSLLNRLETLQIAGMPCRATCAEMLYAELQNLPSLYISEMCLPHSFIKTLYEPCTLPGRSHVWLPRLERLCISPVGARAVCKVVQKRKDAGTPLTSLSLHDPNYTVSIKGRKWLEENVRTFERFQDL